MNINDSDSDEDRNPSDNQPQFGSSLADVGQNIANKYATPAKSVDYSNELEYESDDEEMEDNRPDAGRKRPKRIEDDTPWGEYLANKWRVFLQNFSVILNYMLSEQAKKQEAMKIGIFTIFLVVMIITMLKSVVDSTPILFVKLGQESAGAFDF